MWIRSNARPQFEKCLGYIEMHNLRDKRPQDKQFLCLNLMCELIV